MLKLFKRFLIILSVLLFFIMGCDENNPVEPEVTHFEAIGLFVISGGDTIVKYEGGIVTGAIEVAEGTMTPLLSVKFITEDGEVGIPPTDAWSFGWSVSDTAYAQVASHDDELALYKFHISGKQAGTTGIRISIFHNDHKDFESREIPIQVLPNIIGKIPGGMTGALTAMDRRPAGIGFAGVQDRAGE